MSLLRAASICVSYLALLVCLHRGIAGDWLAAAVWLWLALVARGKAEE